MSRRTIAMLLTLALVGVVIGWACSYRWVYTLEIAATRWPALRMEAWSGKFALLVYGPPLEPREPRIAARASRNVRFTPSLGLGFGVRFPEVRRVPPPQIGRYYAMRLTGSLAGAETGAGIYSRALIVPFWIPVVALSPFPSMRLLRRARRRRRRRTGCCHTCGYDLRASADRCPECGTAFTPSPRYAGERVGERG